MERPLSTAEVSNLLGLDERRIREWVRLGLCRPARHGRRYAFSFQDLVVLRAAKTLLEEKVPPARVRRAIAALVRELPADRPLSGLRNRRDRDDTVCARGLLPNLPAANLSAPGIAGVRLPKILVDKLSPRRTDASAARSGGEGERDHECRDERANGMCCFPHSP